MSGQPPSPRLAVITGEPVERKRRKSSIARVRIKQGTGKFVVNGREVNDYFRLERDRHTIAFAPLDGKPTPAAR
ncbi:MAG: 30S ribosomal protein S9 [Phycisphaerae bacterium]